MHSVYLESSMEADVDRWDERVEFGTTYRGCGRGGGVHVFLCEDGSHEGRNVQGGTHLESCCLNSVD